MTSDTLWPPSDSDTSWSPLSTAADSPGTFSPSPLPSLALEDMDSSALPPSSGVMSSGGLGGGAGDGADGGPDGGMDGGPDGPPSGTPAPSATLPSGPSRPLSPGKLASIDAQVQAWRMPSVGGEPTLRRRETVRPLPRRSPSTPPAKGDVADAPRSALPTTLASAAPKLVPPAQPPTPWDVVLRACDTTRALGYLPGTLFAILVLPHLLTFALVCAAATITRRAARTLRPRRVLVVLLALAATLALAVYVNLEWQRADPVAMLRAEIAHNTRVMGEIQRELAALRAQANPAEEMLRGDIAVNARLMGEIKRELAVVRAQIKDVRRECAGASRFVGKTVRERCRMTEEEDARVTGG